MPIVLSSGHRTDDLGSGDVRFPDSAVDAVRAQVREQLETWGVGPGWTVLTGGSRGADLIVAEEALALGARSALYLADEPAAFVQASVGSATTPIDWPAIFWRVLEQSDVHLPENGRQEGSNNYAQTNRRMLNELSRCRNAGEDVYALLIWNGAPGKAGGTGSLVPGLRKALEKDLSRIVVIDPTPRPYITHQDPGDATTKKKILAIDGGGIRGVIALPLLARMEKQLRHHYRDPTYVLSDYFDLIAGTSVGSIIAAALALGKPVAEITKAFTSLGRHVFTRRLRNLPRVVLAGGRYSTGPLEDQLREFFEKDGPALTLGDPRFKTLFLVTMHNVATDSPWILTNSTQSKYNVNSRLLSEKPDRNLDIPLLQLLCASSSAPTFFRPQHIDVGTRSFYFQDGGVTPFNDPALIALIVATHPVYRLNWNMGPENLLLVSVGTGSRATMQKKPSWLGPMLINLPNQFMSGASFAQDLVARAFGKYVWGPELDREVGHMSDQSQTDLYSYIRYNASLDDKALEALHISSHDIKQLRKLDRADQIHNLKKVGNAAATQVNIPDHFKGFL